MDVGNTIVDDGSADSEGSDEGWADTDGLKLRPDDGFDDTDGAELG